MLRKVGIWFLLLCAPLSLAQAADKYNIDKDHTHIIFLVMHEWFSNTIGRILQYDGFFTFDEKQPQKSEIDITLNANSVATDVPALDNQIKGKYFLNVKNFPTMHFKSTDVIVTGNHSGDVTGDFTMLGITNPLTLHVIYNKSGIHPYTNNYVSGFSADGIIKRSDYGMKAYIPDVADDVHIHLEVEGIDPLRHPGNVKTFH